MWNIRENIINYYELESGLLCAGSGGVETRVPGSCLGRKRGQAGLFLERK